jgi:hypothetical protein
LPQANGAQHHPRLQCSRTGGIARRLFASPSIAYDLSRRGVRGAAGPGASQSSRLWPRYQCVDVAPCRQDELSTRTHPQTRLWRECAACSQTLGKELETRQAMVVPKVKTVFGQK